MKELQKAKKIILKSKLFRALKLPQKNTQDAYLTLRAKRNLCFVFIASFLVNTNCAKEDGEWDHIFEMVIANEIARMIYRLTNEIIILTGG